MKFFHRKYLLTLLILLGLNIKAQNKQIDSLKAVLRKQLNDTSYINTNNQLVSLYISDFNYDTALIYVNNTILFSEQKLKSNHEFGSSVKFNDETTNSIKNGLANTYLHKSTLLRVKDDDYINAEKQCEKALNLFKETNSKKGIAKTYTSIGTIHSDQNNFNKAIDAYNKAIEIYTEINNKKELHTSYHLLGNIYYNQGDFTKALDYQNRSLKITEVISDKEGTSNCYVSLGNVYCDLGSNVKGLEYYFKALKLTKSEEKTSNIYGNIALVYADNADYAKAIDYLLKSADFFKRTGSKSNLAYAFLNIGTIYLDQAKHDEAITYFEKALSLAKALNQQQLVAACYGCIGNVFLAKENYAKALDYQNKSLAVNLEIDDKPNLVYTLNSLGTIYQKQGNTQKAIEYKTKALAIAQEMHFLSLMVTLNKDFSDIYTQLKQPELAFGYYKNYIAARDSLEDTEKAKKLVQMQMQYELEKQELTAKEEKVKTDISHKAELHKKNVIIYASIAFISLIIAFSIILFTRFRLIQKQKRIIEKQKNVIEIRNKNLTDSITTAKRLQDAISPDKQMVDKLIPNNFIYYLPKETISGDFYWLHDTKKYTYIALADCVGHGVPGAMMAVLGHSLLNDIVINKRVSKPERILNRLNKEVFKSLAQSNSDTPTMQGGMAISLCCIEKETNLLHISAADQPVYVIKNNVVKCIEGDMFAMGMQTNDPNFSFTTITLPLDTISAIYLSSDGFKDQFGGEKQKKFSAARFEGLLSEVKTMSIDQQKQHINETFLKWKGNINQVDDVLVVGFNT